jgi:YcxB-like protein
VRLTDEGVRISYTQASIHIAWPAITWVVREGGFWFLYSGGAAVLALPVNSFGPAQTEEFGEFLTDRALLATARQQ